MVSASEFGARVAHRDRSGNEWSVRCEDQQQYAVFIDSDAQSTSWFMPCANAEILSKFQCFKKNISRLYQFDHRQLWRFTLVGQLSENWGNRLTLTTGATAAKMTIAPRLTVGVIGTASDTLKSILSVEELTYLDGDIIHQPCVDDLTAENPTDFIKLCTLTSRTKVTAVFTTCSSSAIAYFKQTHNEQVDMMVRGSRSALTGSYQGRW